MNFQEFKEKYEKVKVEHFPHEVTDKPVVSVCVQTYNHAPYIKECLEGILMQQTDFPFEILLGEDASNDGTREICIEYAQKHPDKIRLLLHHRENNIQIGGQPTGRFNFLYNLYNARGKYIALCEGDDYWTDPLKLQKQVEFMEENEDYMLSHTNCDHLIEKKNKIVKRANEDYQSIGLSTPEKRFKAISTYKLKVKTPTVLFRNINLEEFQSHKKFMMGDTPLWLFLSQKGKFHYLDEVTAVYRIGLNTASKKTSRIKKLKFALSGINMRFYYHQKYGYEVSDALINKYYTTVRNLILITGNGFELNEEYLNKKQILILKRLPKVNLIIRMTLYTLTNFKSALVDIRNKFLYQ